MPLKKTTTKKPRKNKNKNKTTTLTPETKYFFIITSALTKPGHCALSRRAKCLSSPIHPTVQTMASAASVFVFSFDDEAKRGRSGFYNGFNVCQQLLELMIFSPPHYST